MVLFPFAEYWWFYGLFTLFVLTMLALDLGVFHRKAHTVSFKEASIWSVVWVSLALVFNYVLYRYALWKFPQDERLLAIPNFNPDLAAWTVSLEFLTGYIVEKSLSVDNLFVIAVLFGFFAVPAQYQHRVLFWGILGALVMRGTMIIAGLSLINAIGWMTYIFGAVLIFTAFKMLFSGDEDFHPETNVFVRTVRSFFPVTDGYKEHHFWVREAGRVVVTPLGLAIVEQRAHLRDVLAVDGARVQVDAVRALRDDLVQEQVRHARRHRAGL